MESFGKYLREERERRGISIEEISRVTKIGAGQIRSIENDDFAALPPIAFVKGFVRAYAKYLGINSDEAIIRLEQYLSEIEEGEETFGEITAEGFRPASPDPRLILVGATVIFAIIVLGIILGVRSCTRGESLHKPIPPRPVQMEFSAGEVFKNPPFGARRGNLAAPDIPTVPPRSFRVSEVAPPPVTEARGAPPEKQGDSPGGGSPTPRQ